MGSPIKKEQAEVTLPPRIHINQFLFSYPDMTPVQKAGFIAFIGGKTWMREKDWVSKMEEYLKR